MSNLQTEGALDMGVISKFGDYELLSEIARGGMGVVYRARQISLDRVVAVKLILAGQLATRESLDRFRLEARAAAQLHHPGIVRIFEIGECETQHFYSMELIDGESLADCLNEFRITPGMTRAVQRSQERCIAELISRVAHALDFAHQHGVLHRDLKPSNIIIDQQGLPHLTDFGLAKLMGNDAGLSLSNVVMGTPGYVAPEQAAGRGEVTIAADVYGLGATLYELLTGQPPFLGSSAMDTIMQAIQNEPLAPSKRNGNIDRDLNTIAMRCLNNDPKKRYASTRLVAEDLERFLRNEPIVARATTVRERAWRWCSRNPGLVFMLASLFLSISVGMSLVIWQWRRAEIANQRMAANLFQLRWDDIDDMLNKDQIPRALAGVASLLRADPSNAKAAVFGMSILENHNFPVPFSNEIHSPKPLKIARLSPDGTTIATANIDGFVQTFHANTSMPRSDGVQHGSSVRWLEFSPDSRLIVTSSSDGTVCLWDALTLSAIVNPCVLPEQVERVCFSEDGRYLLLVSYRFVTVCDVLSMQPKLGPIDHQGTVIAAKLIEIDGRGLCLFSGQLAGEHTQVRIWSLDTEEPWLQIPLKNLEAADISTRGQKIVTIAQNRGVIWDTQSGAMLHEMTIGEARIHRVEFTKDGSALLICGHNDWAGVFNAQNGLPITKPMRHFYLLNGASFIHDGKRVLTWGDDSLAQVWNARTGERDAEPMLHSQRVCFAEAGVSGNRDVLLTTISHNKPPLTKDQSGSTQLWQIHPKKLPMDFDAEKDPFGYDAHAVSPDGKWIFIAKTTGQAWVKESSSGEVLCGPLQVGSGNWGAIFTPDQRMLIMTTSSGSVSRWEIPSGRLVDSSVNIHTMIQPTELSPDGSKFATGSIDGKCRIWNSSNGQIEHEMDHGSEINSVAFSPDGKWIASAGENHNVCVWDSATGERSLLLAGHSNEVMKVVYSPDQRWIATASLDRTARVWDGKSGTLRYTLSHNGEVIDIVASPDSQWIATGARDRTAMIWDAGTGKPHVRSLYHEQSVRNVVFSPNGKYLLTRDFSGIRLWDVWTGAPLTTHLKHKTIMGTGFQSITGTPQFLPGGNKVFLAMDSQDAFLWEFSMPSTRTPDWFAEFLEAVAGQRFIPGEEMVEFVPTSKFMLLQEKIRDSRETDEYTLWAKQWLGH